MQPAGQAAQLSQHNRTDQQSAPSLARCRSHRYGRPYWVPCSGNLTLREYHHDAMQRAECRYLWSDTSGTATGIEGAAVQLSVTAHLCHWKLQRTLPVRQSP
jgi:hypothetical protein